MKRLTKKNSILFGIIVIVLLYMMSGYINNQIGKTKSNSKELANIPGDEESSIDFVNIPGDGESIESFQMGKTEVTNQQYVDFLNAALKEGKVTVGDVEPLDQLSSLPRATDELLEQMRLYKSKNQQLIFDEYGNRILDLLNIRTTADHDYDGELEIWEAKNPLNRTMIEYDDINNEFRVVDPKTVDWNQYFDESNLPEGIKVVDSINNWGELSEFWTEPRNIDSEKIVFFDNGEYDEETIFIGQYDLDCELPSLEEVKEWPVNYMEYLSAKAFADFYGYDLPTLEEYRWAAKGGKNYTAGTNDGTLTEENYIYNGHSIANDYTLLERGGLDHKTWPGQPKGHVQPVASMEPNPYGIYDLAGNVIEWTKSEKDTKEESHMPSKELNEERRITIGSGWTYPEEYGLISKSTETNIATANDHFGFRVVKRK